MKFFIFFILFCFSVPSFSQSKVIFDAVEKKIEFKNFSLPDIGIKGDVLFNIKQSQNGLIFNLEAKDLFLKTMTLPWLRLRLIKKEDDIFIDNLSFPYFVLKGKFNTKTEDIVFDIDINYKLSTPILSGNVEAKAKVWGKFNNYILNCSLNIFNGRYKEIEFSQILLNLFGSFPGLVLRDSQIVLKNGSTYKIEGRLTLSDIENFFSDIQIAIEKLFLRDWKIIADDFQSIGLRKNIDEKFSILFIEPQNNLDAREGTELNYKIEEDNYLKLRMEQDKSVLGFEVRKEF